MDALTHTTHYYFNHNILELLLAMQHFVMITVTHRKSNFHTKKNNAEILTLKKNIFL